MPGLNRVRLVVFMIVQLLMVTCPVTFAEGEEDPLWNRPSFEKKVIQVGQRILLSNGITEHIQFYTRTTDIRNAYASRFGGPNTVVIYKDLLDVMESDDELAAVLAHEIAHITKRHTGKIVPKRWAAKTALWTTYVVGGTAASVATGGLATPAVILGAAGIRKMQRNGIALTGPISRPYEKEADLAGLDYMVKAGYSPLAMESLMLKIVGDSGPVANFFASHPGGTDRMNYIHQAIETNYPQYLAAETKAEDKTGAPQKASQEKPAAVGTSTTSVASATAPTASESGSEAKPITVSIAKPGPESVSSAATAAQKTRADSTPVSAQGVVKAMTVKAVPKSAPEKSETVKEQSVSSVSEASVALVLLGLPADQLRILRMVNQRGYLSRQELRTQMEYLSPENLTLDVNALIRKRLLRLLGAEPDEVLVLTDWATAAFKPE